MIRTLKSLVLVGVLIAIASPAFAEKELETQVGKFDLDPFDILAPRVPEPAKAEAPAPKKKHKMKHHMKKKM